MPFELADCDPCPFCRYLAEELECAIVAEDPLAVALVNRTQYERGAVLVTPRRHCATILKASDAELLSLYRLARRVAHAAEQALGASGVNVYQNNGLTAGQHVPHLHVHVVPRYPDSDPARMFRQQDFPISPLADQPHIAEALRAELPRP